MCQIFARREASAGGESDAHDGDESRERASAWPHSVDSWYADEYRFGEGALASDNLQLGDLEPEFFRYSPQ